MPAVRSMSSDQEIIEARLAAYVEGDLPAHDRVEIEKYLAGNPQHAKLIKELQAQKGHLGKLPRERAPAEVLDHLQSHLERSALLENVEDAAESMRIRRWPQWSAVAAMLMLAAGLGVLVYRVLPTGEPTQVTIAPPSIQQLPSAPSLDDNVATTRARRNDAFTERESTPSRTELAGGGGTGVDARGQDFVEQLAEQMTANAEQNKLRKQSEQSQPTEPIPPVTPRDDIPAVPGAPAPTNRAMFASLNNGSAILVQTDDPLITQNLVAGFLAQNRIAYETIGPAALDAYANTNGPTTEPSPELVPAGAAPRNAAGTEQPQQQSLPEVVNKLRNRDELANKAQALSAATDEVYLVARNVPAEKAEEISRALGQQRGGKQQARFYGNAELYPELQQQMPGAQQAEQQQQSKVAYNNYNEPKKSAADEPTTSPADPDNVAAAAVTTLPSSTQPTAESTAAVTDLVIVVRADVANAVEPAATQPATSQPTTAPATLPTP